MADEMRPGAAQAPGAAPAPGPGAAPAPEGQGGDPEQAVEGMVSSVQSGIEQLAQLIGQADPALGEAMSEVATQFSGIIDQLTGGGAPQEAQAPIPAQAGVGGVRQQV